MPIHDRIDNDFTLHPPASPETSARMDALRTEAKELAHTFADTCPESRELSLALTLLEQSLFYAIAALARYQEAD